MADRSDCLAVTVIDRVTELNTLGGFVFLVFLGCLILGIIFGLLLARCILRELEEHNMKQRQKNCSVEIVLEGEQEMNGPGTTKKFGSNRIAPQGGGSVAIEMEPTNQSKASLHSQSTSTGGNSDHRLSLAEALTKSSGEEMELELQMQDFKSVEKMEEQLRHQKQETFLLLIKMIFNFLVGQSRVSEGFRREHLAKYEQAIEDIESNTKQELMTEEQELKMKIADPAKLDQELERLHSIHSKRMNSKLLELQEDVGRDLTQESGLSQEEAEQIMEKLMANMAATDRRLAEEANRQSMVFHERLAKRQALTQQAAAEKQQEKDEVQLRQAKPVKDCDALCKKGKLLTDERDRILEEYEYDMKVILENQQQAALKHQNDLKEKLKRKREKRRRKLEQQQFAEKEDFEKGANQLVSEGSMTAEDYLEAQHKLHVEQEMALEQQEEDADQVEAEQLYNLTEALEEQKRQALEEREQALFAEIKKKARLTSKEADRLVKQHQEELQLMSEKKARERERQQEQVKEKLAERRQRWEREMEQQKLEQAQLMSQQEQTIKQVLSTQSGLAEELRKQVMLEHEQNMMALNSHLQMTRLRQQKRLEQQLAKRRARLAELKKDMETERERQADSDPEHLKMLAKSQNIEYQAEVRKVEEEHHAALEDLRRRLAQETEEALKEQDEKLGKILGKLQMEAARREEIIKQQDEAIRSLEKQLVETMTREGTLADAQTERIMKQHQKQVERLNNNIEMEKEKQMRKIREKMEMKQLKKQRELEAKLAKEAEEQKNRGVKSAAQQMMIILTEQRHKREIQDLEREMRLEVARQMEQMNKEMEEQLIFQLQDEEKKLIGSLAEASNATEEDLMQIIKTSASEVGMDAKLTKSITKDVRKRVRSARTPAPDA